MSEKEQSNTPQSARFLPQRLLKLPVFLKLTNTNPFAAWFVVTGDATPDGIRVVRSVFGAISSFVAFRNVYWRFRGCVCSFGVGV